MLCQHFSKTTELSVLKERLSLVETEKAQQDYQAQLEETESSEKQLERQSAKLEALISKNQLDHVSHVNDILHKLVPLEEDARETKSKMNKQLAALSRVESSEMQGSIKDDLLEAKINRVFDDRLVAARLAKAPAKEKVRAKIPWGDSAEPPSEFQHNSHSKASELGPKPSSESEQKLAALKDELDTFKKEIRASITAKELQSKSKLSGLERENATLRGEVAGLQETVKSMSQPNTLEATKFKNEISILGNSVAELRAEKVDQKAFTALEERVNFISSNSGTVNELTTEVKTVTEELGRIKKDLSPTADPRKRAPSASQFPAVEKKLDTLVEHVQHLPGPERFAQMEKDIVSVKTASQWQGKKLERHEEGIERHERDLKADNARINEINQDISALSDGFKDIKSKVRYIDRDLCSLEKDVEAHSRVADDYDSTKVNSLGGQWSARQSETQRLANTMKVHEEVLKTSSAKTDDVQTRLQSLEEKQIPLQNDVKANSSTSKNLLGNVSALKLETAAHAGSIKDYNRILHGSRGATTGLVQQVASVVEQLNELKNIGTSTSPARVDNFELAVMKQEFNTMKANLDQLRYDLDTLDGEQDEKAEFLEGELQDRIAEVASKAFTAARASSTDTPAPNLDAVQHMMEQLEIKLREEMQQTSEEAIARSTPPKMEDIEKVILPKLEQSTSRMVNEKMDSVDDRLARQSERFEFHQAKYPIVYADALADVALFSQAQGKISQTIPAIRNAVRALESRYDNISTRDFAMHVLNTLMPSIGQQLLQPIAKSVVAPLTDQIVPLVHEQLRPQMQAEFNNMRQRIEGASQSNTEIANRNQLLRENQQQLKVKLDELERRVATHALMSDTMYKDFKGEKDAVQKRLTTLDQTVQRAMQVSSDRTI